MKGVVWDDESLGAKFDDIDIPADLVDKAKEYREKMLEAAVELDDDALAAYLDGNEPDEPTLKRLIRKAVLTGAFFPVLCGSAFKNKGVQPLLDAVVDYLPSPIDVPAIKGVDEDGNEIVRLPNDKEPLALLAFKIMDDPFVGTITFCRIYSGTLLSGTGVVNSTRDRKERIGRMLLMHANNREDIKEAYAGDIVALAGLKEARTGDTLCDAEQAGDSRKDGIPGAGDRDRDRAEDRRPTRKSSALRWRSSPPRIRRSASRPTRNPARPSSRAWANSISTSRSTSSGAPTRSMPTSARRRWRSVSASPRGSSNSYTHKKQTGGTGQFAAVTLIVEPNEPGKGYEFESKVVGGAVPKEYIPGVEKGIESVLTSGVVAGFPIVDVKVQLIDGKYHDVDSSALAFEIATRACFREALQKGKSVLLEPIMKVEVVTPEDYTGSVIGDLNSRRGQIQGQDMRGNANVINAMVPLMNMFGYVNNLRSMSQGRATFTMQFDHYAEAPANVSAEVQKKFA